MNNKKKIIIIAVVSAVIVLAGIIFAVVIGNKNKNLPVNTYSAEVHSEYIEFFDGDELIQVDRYPEGVINYVDFEYAKEHIEFVDLDFDGKLDACLAISKNNNVIKYVCWINTDGRFVYNKELSKLTTISVDDKNKEIIAVNYSENGDEYVVYIWENGILTEKSRMKTDSPDVPAEIVEAVQNKSVGNKTDETTKTRSETSESTVETTKKQNNGNNNTNTTKKDNNNIKSTTKNASEAEATKAETEPVTEEASVSETPHVYLATGDMNEGWF